MPPSISAIPVPETRGHDARRWLEAQGLVARVPFIRSSDLGLVGRCPFLYYLVRRLGLVPALSWSQALSRGSWMHTVYELSVSSPSSTTLEAAVLDRLKTRHEELRAVVRARSLSNEALERIISNERYDAMTALAWHSALRRCTHPSIPDLAHGLEGPFHDTRVWRTLSVETPLLFKHPDFSGTPLCIVADRILYNINTNRIWVLDLKTTSLSPIDRAQSFTVDFQCWHYLYVASKCLPLLIQQHGLPSSCELGGMVHLVVQKPTIQLSAKDRPYVWTSEGKRTGVSGRAYPDPLKPDQWATEVWPSDNPHARDTLVHADENAACEALQAACGKAPTRFYAISEPDWRLYSKRVYQWYTGTGDYKEKEADYLANPPILFSWISASSLDDDALSEYTSQLSLIHRHATAQPIPSNFFRTSDGMTNLSGLNEYAPFFVSPPSAWPDIVRREGFIQTDRGEESLLDLITPSIEGASADV